MAGHPRFALDPTNRIPLNHGHSAMNQFSVTKLTQFCAIATPTTIGSTLFATLWHGCNNSVTFTDRLPAC
jgi:hypothetical protein